MDFRFSGFIFIFFSHLHKGASQINYFKIYLSLYIIYCLYEGTDVILLERRIRTKRNFLIWQKFLRNIYRDCLNGSLYLKKCLINISRGKLDRHILPQTRKFADPLYTLDRIWFCKFWFFFDVIFGLSCCQSKLLLFGFSNTSNFEAAI